MPAHATVDVIVNGALEESATFTDETLMADFIAGVREDAEGDGYPTEVFIPPPRSRAGRRVRVRAVRAGPLAGSLVQHGRVLTFGVRQSPNVNAAARGIVAGRTSQRELVPMTGSNGNTRDLALRRQARRDFVGSRERRDDQDYRAELAMLAALWSSQSGRRVRVSA